MISSATVQSAIVLTNRKMKAERGVITFVPVCSKVTGMRVHHLEGRLAAQERSAVRIEEDADYAGGHLLHLHSSIQVC